MPDPCSREVIVMLVYLQKMDDPKDKIKLEQLYRLYKDYMLHIADSILHNKQDAEDAAHEAFLSIAANIKKVSDPVSPKTRSYIVIITERKATDIYRKHKRRGEEELTEAAGIGSGPRQAGENSLMDCIDRLSDRDREAILLRYSHGYRIGEIAKMLGLSYAAAAKLVERAKEKLDRLCREEGLL